MHTGKPPAPGRILPDSLGGAGGVDLHADPSRASNPMLRAAPGLQDLPAVPINLFTRAAAIVAKRAARAGAPRDDVEGILARGLAHARAIEGGGGAR